MSDDKLATGPEPDAYHAQHMAKGALYYDKIRSPLAYHLLFLLPLLTTFGSAIVGHTPLAVPIVTSLVIFFTWALFSVLRVSVTREEVFVQYGLFGPKIAVGDIEQCEAVDYDWKKYGGWGIRYGRDGSVAYNMLGDGGRAVRIVYRKGNKKKTVLLASRQPERLAAAIQQARAEGRKRIEAPPAEVDALTREAEAEVEAASDEARRRL